MIIYLHGFDSNSPGNHEKVLQLQFIDPDVRLISYSTRHPKHDMQHLLKEVDKMLQLNVDERPLICGVGLGGYWAERIGFLCDIRQVIFNPNLFPYENMEGKKRHKYLLPYYIIFVCKYRKESNHEAF